MKNLITGIHHTALKCSSQKEWEAVKNFYGDVLGLPLIRSWGENKEAGMMFDTGRGLIEVFASGEEKLPQGAVRHFALATEDVDGCVEAVKAAGYEVFVKPKDIVIGSVPPFPARIAFCIGPVGEEIEFFQEQ